MLFWNMISAINMDIAMVNATFNNLWACVICIAVTGTRAKGDSGLGRSDAVILAGHVMSYVPKYFVNAEK